MTVIIELVEAILSYAINRLLGELGSLIISSND